MALHQPINLATATISCTPALALVSEVQQLAGWIETLPEGDAKTTGLHFMESCGILAALHTKAIKHLAHIPYDSAAIFYDATVAVTWGNIVLPRLSKEILMSALASIEGIEPEFMRRVEQECASEPVEDLRWLEIHATMSRNFLFAAQMSVAIMREMKLHLDAAVKGEFLWV